MNHIAIVEIQKPFLLAEHRYNIYLLFVSAFIDKVIGNSFFNKVRLNVSGKI